MQIALGLGALCLGAEVLVRGAVSLAARLRVGLLVVGLTIVAFGTSAPELAVSVGAGLRGLPGIAVGNIVGSNLFNAAFILGVSALVRPLAVHHRVVRWDLPVAAGAAVLLLVFVLDGKIERAEGLGLLGVFGVYLFWVVRRGRRESLQEEASGLSGAPPRMGVWPSWLSVAAGLVALSVGSRVFLRGAVSATELLGLPQAVVGLTLAAVGTSLPELATSVTAARRGEADLAVGNIVGSNTFNVLAALGASTALRSTGLGGVNWVDLWVMVGVTLVLFPLLFTGMRLTRWEGAILVAVYLGYLGYALQRSAPGLT